MIKKHNVFNDYQFGYADAEKEYIRLGKYLDEVFWDPKKYIDELINKWSFIVVGRKGVGKTAYCSKLRSMKSLELITTYMPLNKFEYTTFSKTSGDKDLTGTQKFKNSWDFVLLCLIYKSFLYELNITENTNVNNVIALLGKLGFSIDFNYKDFVHSLSKLKVGANVKLFDIEFEKQFGNKPSDFLDRLISLNNFMESNLDTVYLAEKKLFLLIDGVDDILRLKKNKIEILSSLIRSADYLNMLFSEKNLKIKIVIFIRDDIFSLINDTDINKIKQDSSIKIDWSRNLDDLKEIINLRVKFNLPSSEDITYMFPEKINKKFFWEYLLEHTLYRPRDVIQYFKCCQELYGEKEKLSVLEVKEVTKQYSHGYFMEEMKNELAGFVLDDIISVIPSVFKKISNRSFSASEFNMKLNEQLKSQEVSINASNSILLVLFENGYVGQIIASGRHKEYTSVCFKHRNPTAQVDYSENFIIHKALNAGLGVKL